MSGERGKVNVGRRGEGVNEKREGVGGRGGREREGRVYRRQTVKLSGSA